MEITQLPTPEQAFEQLEQEALSKKILAYNDRRAQLQQTIGMGKSKRKQYRRALKKRGVTN